MTESDCTEYGHTWSEGGPTGRRRCQTCGDVQEPLELSDIIASMFGLPQEPKPPA